MRLDGARRARAVFAGAAIVGFVLLEVVRVWLPSVLFVLGDTGGGSAMRLAAFGAICLGIAPALAGGIGRLTPVMLWWWGAGALVVGRGALVVDLGGTARLAAASVAVVGATTAIVALAAGGHTDQSARMGVLSGLVGATCLHVGTRTLGLVWPGTAGAIAGSVLLVAALGTVTWRVGRHLGDAEAAGSPTPHGGPAWTWWTLTPVLLLIAAVSGVPGRMAVATGWSAPTIAATVAGAHLAALLAAVFARRLGPIRSGLLAAAAISGGTAASLDAVGWSGVIGPITLVVGLGLLVGSDLGATGRPSSERARGVVAGLALLTFGAIVGSYYAAYDLNLPVNNRLLLLGTALFGSLIALATFRLGRGATTRSTLDLGLLARRAGLAALILGLVAVSARPPDVGPAVTADPDRIRVATFNVRSGFDLDGRFAAREQAAVLRAYAPDVVVLNEVDRGWLASGGHDALEVLAGDLGLPHVMFSRAADEVFGNALLSRYPIRERASEPLPRGSDPMRRSLLVAVLDLDDGRPLGIIGTHLSHVDDQGDTRLPQARAVAATVAILRERQVPTVLLGDLNAEPGSSELATFESLLEDALPDRTATFPSDRPTVHLDHVLVSSELRATEVVVPEVTVSDHRPVVVELRLPVP